MLSDFRLSHINFKSNKKKEFFIHSSNKQECNGKTEIMTNIYYVPAL